MEFRWAALIALWTFLIGPILGAPTGSGSTAHKPAARAAKPAAVRTSVPHLRR